MVFLLKLGSKEDNYLNKNSQKNLYHFLCRTASTMPSLTFYTTNNWILLRTLLQACTKFILHGLRHSQEISFLADPFLLMKYALFRIQGYLLLIVSGSVMAQHDHRDQLLVTLLRDIEYPDLEAVPMVF